MWYDQKPGSVSKTALSWERNVEVFSSLLGGLRGVRSVGLFVTSAVAGRWVPRRGICALLSLKVIFPLLFLFGRDRMMLLKLEQEILEFISDSK